MTLIEWKDEFSVGVASVDHEHRALIDMINELEEAMRGNASQTDVIAGLGEIYARISAHFALEEKIMREAAYPDLGSHKADHEQLLDQLLEIMDTVGADGAYDRVLLSGALDQWFSDHFRTHDAELHRRFG
jgi:hemerythrin